MSQIEYTLTSSKDIARTIDKIRPVVHGLDENVISQSCIAIAILMQAPSIDLKPLMELMKSTSEYIALSLMPANEVVN